MRQAYFISNYFLSLEEWNCGVVLDVADILYSCIVRNNDRSVMGSIWQKESRMAHK